MTDFSKCPSCQVPADPIRDGTVEYKHQSSCQVGTITNDKSHVYCSKCKAKLTYSDLDTTKPGTWLAKKECPICWIVALSDPR